MSRGAAVAARAASRRRGGARASAACGVSTLALLTSGGEVLRVRDVRRIQGVQQRVDALRHPLYHQVAGRLHRVADQIEARETRLWNHVLALSRAVDRPLAAILAHRQDVDARPKGVAKEIAQICA